MTCVKKKRQQQHTRDRKWNDMSQTTALTIFLGSPASINTNAKLQTIQIISATIAILHLHPM